MRPPLLYTGVMRRVWSWLVIVSLVGGGVVLWRQESQTVSVPVPITLHPPITPAPAIIPDDASTTATSTTAASSTSTNVTASSSAATSSVR